MGLRIVFAPAEDGVLSAKRPGSGAGAATGGGAGCWVWLSISLVSRWSASSRESSRAALAASDMLNPRAAGSGEEGAEFGVGEGEALAEEPDPSPYDGILTG